MYQYDEAEGGVRYHGQPARHVALWRGRQRRVLVILTGDDVIGVLGEGDRVEAVDGGGRGEGGRVGGQEQEAAGKSHFAEG